MYIDCYKKIILSIAQVLMHMDFEIFLIRTGWLYSFNPIKLMPSKFIRNHNGKIVNFLAGGKQDLFTEAFCTNKAVLSVLFVHLEWLAFIINNINPPLSEKPDSLLLPNILQSTEGWRITDIERWITLWHHKITYSVITL